jgi:PAS domain S-box-containing protein
MRIGFSMASLATVAVLLWLGTVLPLGAGVAPEGLPTLTRLEQVRTLTPDEARRGYRVSLVGVVVFSDPNRGLLFVHDATGGVFIIPQARAWAWRVGEQVRITGLVEQGSHLPFINQALLQDLGPGTLPTARPVTVAQLATDTEDGNWVEVRAVVRTAALKEGRLVLEIVAEGKRLRAVFTDMPASSDELGVLVDAEVRLQAVCGMVFKESNNPILLDLHVPSLAHLEVEVKAPEQPFLASARPLTSLRRPLPAPVLVHRILVKGILTSMPDGALHVTDPTGTAWIQPVQPVAIQSNVLVEVLGFPGGPVTAPVLEDAIVRFLDLSWPQAAAVLTNAVREHLPVLTQAKAVRELPVSEAERGYPVRIQGVVTCVDQEWNLLFVQDETSGIYVLDSPATFAGKVGQVVEVEGFSGSGWFAPIIREPQLGVLGQGQLPKAKPVSLDQLKMGSEDSQRVEIQGTVQRLAVESEHLTLDIAGTSGGMLKAHVPGFGTNPVPTGLVDAEVQVRGVCGSLFNTKRQLTGIQLFVVGLEDIRVSKPAPADLFVLPVRPINGLLQFQLPNNLRHRLHVRGIVTFRDPRWYTLFIQDESDGIYVRTLTRPAMPVGDQLDVVGFIRPGPFGPEMSEAIFQRIGPGKTPQPVTVTIAGAISGEFDAHLITLDARLVDRVRGTGGHGLVLQGEQWTLTAFLEDAQDARRLDGIRLGSLLRLTGVCSIQSNESQPGKALLLQMRSPDDVIVLNQPPWWTTRHWLALLGVGAVILMAVGAWVLLLRQSVREQTEVIRRELEREAALEAQYRELFENVNDLIQSFNPDGSIAYVNPAWLKAMGYTPAEVTQLTFRDIIYPDDLRHCAGLFESVMSGGQLDFIEARFRRKDGQLIEVEGSCSASIKDGKPSAIRCIFRDVTERRRAEETLRQTQQAMIRQDRLAAVGQLAAGVAHEFNNLLTIIQGHTALLLEGGRFDPQTTDALKDVTSAAGRATSLTRQLLAFSRKQIMQPKTLDLNDAIGNIMRMLQRLLGEHIVLQMDLAPNLPSVCVDLGLIEQVLVNLVVNARDAMPQGGPMTLRTRAQVIQASSPLPHPEARPGPFVSVSVSDTGCGMDATVREHLFEPFFTTKDVGKGTGLGLATIYGIVKQHEGWIEVETAVNQGSTFTVFLPAVLGAPKPVAERSSTLPMRGGSEAILVVEDESALRALVVRILTRYGYKVYQAANGVEALELGRQHAGQLRLLLTDMVMPEGISGRELADQMRAEHPSLKVIYTSGYSMDFAGQDMALRSGINFLAKPYEPSALASAVRECLDENTPLAS